MYKRASPNIHVQPQEKDMHLQVFLLVLVALQLGSAQQCGVVVLTEDKLREEINSTLTTLVEEEGKRCKEHINTAVQWAVENITGSVQQLLAPILQDLALHKRLGRTSHHPASSCQEIADNDPFSPPGYYWIQTAQRPLVQVYCRLYINSQTNPADSCKHVTDIDSEAMSGLYWIKNSEGKAIQVHCDMERECGGVTGGWMRVANIDMRRSNNTCPSGLNTLLVDSKRLCSKNIAGGGCSSATLAVQKAQYSLVCGKIIGYQQNTPDGFHPYYARSTTIDGTYADGISLTHGQSPRKHIWTLVAALHEYAANWQSMCPCTNRNNPETITIPPFVGNDYFCDTGSRNNYQHRFYPDDPLWDGQGCGSVSSCCSFNNPPWFSKRLTSPTTEDIEMRLCGDSSRDDEDITFEQLELYVQ